MATSPTESINMTASSEVPSDDNHQNIVANEAPSQNSPVTIQHRPSPPLSMSESIAAATPPHMSDISSSSVKSMTSNEHVEMSSKWGWWQGYRNDRTMLGFEAPPGKNVTLMNAKKPQKRRRRDDD